MDLHELALTAANKYLNSERDLLRVLIEVDRARVFEKFEFTHLTPYCVGKLGLSEDIAKCLVRVVRKSHEVPELGAAVISGEVSLYKARAICSAVNTDNSEEWIAKARKLSKSQLEEEVASARGVQTRKVSLSFSFETVEKLKRARDVLSTMSSEYRSLEDAIDRMADEFLFKHDPVEKARRSRDPSVKQQVDIRDGGRCSIIYADGSQCAEEKWIHKHHVIHRKDGGPDTVENLVSLCAGHHRMIHRTH